jgi:hypothetical protein
MKLPIARSMNIWVELLAVEEWLDSIKRAKGTRAKIGIL